MKSMRCDVAQDGKVRPTMETAPGSIREKSFFHDKQNLDSFDRNIANDVEALFPTKKPSVAM